MRSAPLGNVPPDPVLLANSFTSRWRAWRESKRPVLQFALRFGCLMALFYAVALLPGYERVLHGYLKANAWLAGLVLTWLGQTCHVSEIVIQSGHFAIGVRQGCDALEPSWFFSAAVLSFAAPPRRKSPGILLGVVVLQLLNLLRIVSLYFIGLRFPRYFNMAHVEIWPAAFIVATIILWIQWIRWMRSHEPLET